VDGRVVSSDVMRASTHAHTPNGRRAFHVFLKLIVLYRPDDDPHGGSKHVA
jgi:hypothetical protein